KVDIITEEVVRNYLITVAEEMKKTIIRTSMSPIIYEVLDFSTGVFNRSAQLVAQAAGLAIFLGTLDWAVKATLDKFGEQNLHPGDIIITNDPYSGGGTHLNDVAMVAPAFYQNRLVGFTAVRAHWLDVGGKAPFSQMTDATDIYQEGLQFPIIKLYEAGQPNQTLIETISANVREPRFVIGDMNAQVAACRIGQQRLSKLLDKYGPETVDAAIEQIMTHSEQATRQAIASIPDGTYEGEDFLDSAGPGGQPCRIHVRIHKQGTQMTFDFSNSDPQTRTSYNTGYCGLVSACRVMLKAITDPHTPANDGSFRPLQVIAREGTLVCAKRPAPICMYGEVSKRVCDAIWKALAPVLPDRLPAGHYGTVCAQGLAGWDDRFQPPRYTMHGGPNSGGWGAWPGGDGENALMCLTNGDARNTPVEIIEAKNPLLVTRFELRPDSGGAGQWRGGLGTIIEYQVTTHGYYTAVFVVERTRFRPFGLAGGEDGAPNDVILRRGDQVTPGLGKAVNLPLQYGDIVTMVAGGGGGYGPPEKRDPEAVAKDVRYGYISHQAAREKYKVVLKPDGEVDWEATLRERNQTRPRPGPVENW
ncbi:MAG: hydantoinase B/oxoprolinase family protein, partial [Bacillota bacterium]